MNSDLNNYLELCCEKEDINDLIIVSNEGLPIALASSILTSDQILVSGMCTALKCIGRELIRETMDSDFKRMLVDCTEGVILIQPLNPRAILVASCRTASVLKDIDIPSIQLYLNNPTNSLVAL